MLGLPKATEVHKQLPKKALYSKFQMSTKEKESIDSDISRITIVNELNTKIINIKEGNDVKSFFVLLVSLKKKNFDEKNIVKLSKLIPQNLVMILEFEDEQKIVVNYTKLIQSDWNKEEFKLDLKGLNLDEVWQNIIIQIGNIQLKEENSLKEQIQQNEQREKLLKEINKLEKMARSERQPRKKFELVNKLKQLQKEMENI